MMEYKISDKKKRNGILRICFVRNDILCKKRTSQNFMADMIIPYKKINKN